MTSLDELNEELANLHETKHNLEHQLQTIEEVLEAKQQEYDVIFDMLYPGLRHKSD